MTRSLLAFSLLALSSFASAADIGMAINANCESPEARSAMGPFGSCRVVVAPQQVTKIGKCKGAFDDYATCEASYYSSKYSSYINFKCYTNPNSPMIDERFTAEGITFNASTIVRRDSGQYAIAFDPRDITLVTSEAVELMVIESTNNRGIKQTQGFINVNLESEKFELTDVKCE